MDPDPIDDVQETDGGGLDAAESVEIAEITKILAEAGVEVPGQSPVDAEIPRIDEVVTEDATGSS